ncbi:MAG TPA: hypothetical protein VE445_01525 [Nitrososphaeraceae archaeon]|jgi:hypothetical protein|nr:hypothetical protein [Nitrososphaeraceae archaeon]
MNILHLFTITTEQCAYVTIADAMLPGNMFNPVLPLFSTILKLYIISAYCNISIFGSNEVLSSSTQLKAEQENNF